MSLQKTPQKRRFAFEIEGPNVDIFLKICQAEKRSKNRQLQLVVDEWIETQRTARPDWFKRFVTQAPADYCKAAPALGMSHSKEYYDDTLATADAGRCAFCGAKREEKA